MKNMTILMTNDDGYDSPGLSLLAAALRRAGHRVLVLAPDSDRSGVSHAISFISGPCKITKIDEDTWSCAGTPVDCVVLALLGGIPGADNFNPDMVISGINRGANLGTDLLYSGTAAAARQAGMAGYRSLAFSLVEGKQWHWDTAVSFIIEKLPEIMDYWKPDTFVNVNIPNTAAAPEGIIPAFPARRMYTDTIDRYHSPSGEIYCFTRAGKISAEHQAGSDHDAVRSNRASMTAIYIHPAAFEEIDTRRGKN
jgi:5'-nucleotidase